MESKGHSTHWKNIPAKISLLEMLNLQPQIVSFVLLSERGQAIFHQKQIKESGENTQQDIAQNPYHEQN